jgi:hypothetical protein
MPGWNGRSKNWPGQYFRRHPYWFGATLQLASDPASQCNPELLKLIGGPVQCKIILFGSQISFLNYLRPNSFASLLGQFLLAQKKK